MINNQDNVSFQGWRRGTRSLGIWHRAGRKWVASQPVSDVRVRRRNLTEGGDIADTLRHDAVGKKPVDSARRGLGERAVAAVEFALATPLLFVILGGAADLGLSQYCKASLANAVATGAEYAVMTGTSVTSANIRNVVQYASFLDKTSLSVTVIGPASYCVTGATPTLSSVTAGSNCSDGTIAGQYVQISAIYTNQRLMNGFLGSSSLALTESATVRLQ